MAEPPEPLEKKVPIPSQKKKKRARPAGADNAESISGLFASKAGGVSELLSNSFGGSSASAASSSDKAELAGAFTQLFDTGKEEARKIAAEQEAKRTAVVATEEAERVVHALRGKRNWAAPLPAKDASVDADIAHVTAIAAPDLDYQPPQKKSKILTPDEKEDQNARTLFIGNVPLEWNEKNLKAALNAAVGEKYTGKYHPIWFRNQPVKEKWANPFTRRVGALRMDYAMDSADDKCAYVVVNSKEAFEIVRQAMHGLKADSTHILRADGINEQSKLQSFDRKKSVFVGNLPKNAGEADLRKVFEQCGEVSAVRVVRDTVTKYCKGIAFVLFKERSAVPLALEYWGTNIRGREIRVSKVEKQEGDDEEKTPTWAKKSEAKGKAWQAWRVEEKLQKMRKNHASKAKKRQAAAKRDGNTTINEKKKKKTGGGKLKVPKKAGKAMRTKATEAAGKLKVGKKKLQKRK